MTLLAEVKKLSAEKQEIFERMSVPRAVATLAIPTIISQIVITLYNLADTFFIGQMKDPYMVAAISLLYPWVHLQVAIANFFGVGTSSLISRMLGSKRHDEVKGASSFCLFSALCATAVFSLITAIIMKPLLTVLGASPETMPHAVEYTVWVVVIGSVPTVLQLTLAHLLRSEGHTKKASFGMMLGGILNMALDPIFIFGFGLNVAGAAIATMLSNAASTAYFFWQFYRLRGETTISFRPRDYTRRYAGEIFSVGITSALNSILTSTTTMIIVRLSAAYGDVAIAAYGIVKKINTFTFNLSFGLCQGVTPLIGYNYAAKNYKRLQAVTTFTWRISIFFSLACIATYILFAHQILFFFIPEPETAALGASLLRISCFSVLMNSINTLVTYALQAMGRGKQSRRLALLRHAILNIPLLFVLNHFFGVYGVNGARLCAELLATPFFLLIYRKALQAAPK